MAAQKKGRLPRWDGIWIEALITNPIPIPCETTFASTGKCSPRWRSFFPMHASPEFATWRFS
jgi:hypothetical protein